MSEAEPRRVVLRCAVCGDEIAVGTIETIEDRCVGPNAENTQINFSSWEHGATVELRCPDCAG